ncbi:hypothetical protein N431DRAFT_496584 [Stipitochalara longipes BDJ]|nr:hypothetical protein N431DRAFT_496584 [Stipitochalara longipes BDJ]
MTRLQQLYRRLPKLLLPSPLPQTRATFTLFSKLPIEMRHMIWRHTAMEPRTIELTTEHRGRQPYDNQNRAPAAIHTCQESRKEGKRYYQRCAEKISSVAGPRAIPNIIWINFAVDCFSFSTDDFLEQEKLNFDEAVLHQVGRLLIHDDCYISADHRLSHMRWLYELPNLRVLTLQTKVWDAHCMFFDGVKMLLERDLVYQMAKRRVTERVEQCVKKHGLKGVQLHVVLPYDATYDGEFLGRR